MRLNEHFDYTIYSEILHLSKFELAFCLGYFFLALIICLYSTPGGSLFTPDSIAYVQQAENIYLNHDFRTVSAGPVYPSLIAIIMGLGLTSEQSAGIIPIIFYSLLGFPLFLLGKTINRSITGYISCIVSFFSGKYLLHVSTYAMTEMPYIFFTIVAILFIVIFNRYGYVRSINIAGIFILLATLTRYIGFVLIPVGIIVIVMNIKDFRKALITVLNFSLISSIPVGMWVLVRSANSYVMSPNLPIRPFSTTIHQFRVNLEQLFYNDYGIVALIIMLFVIIAIIAIYLSKRLIVFTKDTIPLTGYITIYCIMMILVTSSYGNYSLTNALDLRYITPIFPFVVLFVFSSFSDKYNNKNIYKTEYKLLPVILCAILVAQGASSLYFKATDIRTTSLADYSDRDLLNTYISENNIGDLNKIYIERSAGWMNFQMGLHMTNPDIKFGDPVIANNIPGKTIFDNLTSHYGTTSEGTLAELIERNKDIPTYIIVPIELVAQVYMLKSSKDVCWSNPYKFTRSAIFKASVPKNNESCNSILPPEANILDKNKLIEISLAGNFMGTKHIDQDYDQLLLLSSNLSDTRKDEYNLQIIDFIKGSFSKSPYPERSGTTQPIIDRFSKLLTGDFMGLGYDQALSIERDPSEDKIAIEDFIQGKSPAIIKYSEVLSNNSTFKNLIDAEDTQLAGDFMGLGHSQVLFMDRNPKTKRLIIADFTKDKLSMTREIPLRGDSARIVQWLDDKDLQFAGDFMGLGHSQVLFINRNHTKEEKEKIMIVDFSNGKDLPSFNYQENWGETIQFAGWLDTDDTQLVGDFMHLGHSQVLLVNHGHNGGKIMIVDFSQGKPPAEIKYWEHWNSGTILEGWLGLNDTKIAGDFKGLGYSQVLFLNSSINGLNATILDFPCPYISSSFNYEPH